MPAPLIRGLRHLEAPFNFGLYFNKWLYAEWKVRGGSKFPAYEFQGQGQAKQVLTVYEKLKPRLFSLLEQKRREADSICQAFRRLGYEPLNNTYELKTSLIIGLGNAHPTERGFTFHWTLGIPYLPAESLKGVVRLAYLIEQAENDPSFFEHWAKEDETFWELLARPFGRAEGENPARRGKVIFLDALPVKPPELMLEITTCHYPDYYAGNRGPTEDQNPNPLPFLAVAPGTKFRFVLLVAQNLGEEVRAKLLKAFQAALTDHGFGAKTALGHGRFS